MSIEEKGSGQTQLRRLLSAKLGVFPAIRSADDSGKWLLFAGLGTYVVPFGISRASRKSFAMFWKISFMAVTEVPGDSQVLLDPLWL